MKFERNFCQNEVHYTNGRQARFIDDESTEPHFMKHQSLTDPRLVVNLTEAIPLCNILYTVSTQHQYSDIMYAIGYTVATCFDR